MSSFLMTVPPESWDDVGSSLCERSPLPVRRMAPPVKIDLSMGMPKVREILSRFPIKTRLEITGTLIVARDAAHARLKKLLDEGKPMPALPGWKTALVLCIASVIALGVVMAPVYALAGGAANALGAF